MAVSELRARGAQEEILLDRGDANGKGRGALRRLCIIGLVITTATILVGIGSKRDDETLMQWGTDVAEVSAASLAGLGNYVSKGPSAAASVPEPESIGSEGGAGAAGVDKSKGAGVASTALAAADCPRCVQRAQMHLQRALANDTGS